MSVGVVNKSTGDRIQTAGDPLDKVGNLANLTTSAKANAVEAINEVNAGKANQAQLATVEASTTASKPYSAGEYLVLGGVLYKVTANIAQGGTIVTEGAGKNVDLATVGGELATLKSGLTGKQNRDFTLVGTIDVNGTINLSGYKEVYFTPEQNYVSPIIPVINGTSCMYYVDDTNYIRISIDISMVATLLCNSTWADNCGVYAR